MDSGLQSSVQALDSGQKRMEYIAANLANLQAPGFKKLVTFTEVIEQVQQGRTERKLETNNQIDFTQGHVEHTGNPLDLALDGDGFFALETESGEAYTRNGRFHLDAQGTLLNEDGFLVVWEGAPGKLQPVGDEIRVDPTGTVRQGENSLGRLKLVDFADRTALELDGRGTFRAPPLAETLPATAEVRGAALERSNADSIDELVSLIRVQRSFENAAQLLRTIDQSYKRLNQPR